MRVSSLRRVVQASRRSVSTVSRRPMMPRFSPRRGVAPKSEAHAEASHGDAHSSSVTENLSPEMQKYIKTDSYLFGEKPLPEGEQRKLEVWEIPFWIVVACALGLPFIVSNTRGSPSLYDWARDEAEERIRRRLDGKTVEYGYNYAALRAIREGLDEVEVPSALVPAKELAQIEAADAGEGTEDDDE